MWRINSCVALLSFLLIWNTQKQQTNNELQYDPTPLGYCSQLHNVSDISAVYSSLRCHLLVKVKVKNSQRVFASSELFWIPTTYCSQVTHVTNDSQVFSSALCSHLTLKQTWEAPKPSLQNIPTSLWFCSKEDYRNGSRVFYSSVEWFSLNTAEKMKPSLLWIAWSHENDDELSKSLLWTSFAINCLACAIIFLILKTYTEKTHIHQNSYTVEEEENRYSEAASQQHRKEELRQQQRKREEIARETERKGLESVLTLLHSLTLTLLEETRNFNEWMESPD